MKYSYLFDQPTLLFERLIANLEKVIIGKKEVLEQVVICLLCGGHVLLEDVPGTGKTMLARALAKTVDCTFKRIQFTPDMLPSDVTGVSVFNRQSGTFEYHPGPLMAHMVLADELNRTSPKTQAAMLEAMEERNVTVDGTTHKLPEPFWLIATQNPLDHEGTFTLPEAQTDRFLMKLSLGYPEERDEVGMLSRMEDKDPLDQVRPVLMREELQAIQQEVRRVFVDPSLREYIVALAGATRRHEDVVLGASPRASLALQRAAQCRAFVSGRSYCVPDDVKAVAVPVLAHRLMLTHDAKYAGKRAETIVEAAMAAQHIPVLRQAAAW